MSSDFGKASTRYTDPCECECHGGEMMDEMRFDGDDYQPPRDNPRLSKQYLRVFDLMSDAHPRTLRHIADATGDPEASVSAQLRHMRKERFGSHTVEKEYSANGLYFYRLLVKQPDEQMKLL